MQGDEVNAPRIRIKATETSKGEWYFEATAETDNVEKAAGFLIDAVTTAQNKFKEAGKKVVPDTFEKYDFVT